MDEIVNPYIAGAPVAEKRMFFGREDVFEWIERSLSGQYAEHILVVHGQRRVGKTSVLKQLGNHLPDRYVPILFDLQGRTNTTLDRFMWWLASGIVRALKQERDISIASPDRDLFTRDSDYFENHFLPDLRSHLGKEKVLLLTFDEFDNLEEGDVKNSLARPLIDQLRRLMEHSDLNFIFSIGSSGRKLENMQATYTEFFKAALYRKISFLTKDDGYRLITLPVKGILEYDKDAVERIYQIVSGHPYFTQLVCHELFSLCQKTGQRTVSRNNVDGILDDVVERGTVNLKFVWDEAADLEKWALSSLAQLDGKHNNNRAVADFLAHQRVRFNQQALDSALLHLREKDVLTEDNRFVNHLLQIWMKKNRPIEQVREELTEVNPIVNRYIEIGLEFKHNGSHDKAIESFMEALEIDSDNLQAQVSLALVYLDQKNIDKAIVEFEKARLIDDEDIATRSGLCDAYLAQGDQVRARPRSRDTDAILVYQKVLAINNEHTEARQRLAEIYRQRAEKALVDGKDEDVLSAFTEALKYTPEDIALVARVEQVRAEKKAKVLAAQVARSEKEANARNWEKAIAALNEALETSPGDEVILKKIALIKERQLKERLDTMLAKADQAEKNGRWEATIAALNEYLNLSPDDAAIQKRLTALIEARHAAWLNSVITRADQAVASQNWDEAIAALNEVLTREPENAEIQNKILKVRDARRVAELNALLKRVEMAVQAGRWDDAINELNNGIASKPENETLQTRLIEVRKAKREARLKATIRLVDTATQSGNWDTAIDVLKEALAIEPENQTLQLKLMGVHKAKHEAGLKAALQLADNATRSGNWDAAINALNEILVVEPENEEFKEKLAQVKKEQRESRLNSLRLQARGFAKAEKFEEALAAWHEYLTLDPDDRTKAQAEIESVKKAQSLANRYAEAYKAYSKSNYEKAIGLFKSIVVEDTDYKDATRLLSESIELRRTARKWWQSKWLWGGLGGLAVLTIGWFTFRPGSPLMNVLLAPSTAPGITDTSDTPVPGGNGAGDNIATEVTELLPTAIPTPLPLAWARLNSGQFLSRDQITAIVFDPADSGVIYVSMKNAGIYKSIDGGSSWQPSQNGLESKSIQSLVIDPENSNILFAGAIQGGVYKTGDGGANWQAVNNGIKIDGRQIIGHVLIDSQDSQHLWYSGSFTPPDGSAILYETKNGGESWQQIKNTGCMDGIVDIAAHPKNSQILIAGLFNGHSTGCDGGAYLSEDGGNTWKIIGLEGKRIDWVAISITKDARELIYAYSNGELFGSPDRGKTWTNNLCTSFCQPLATDLAGNVIISSNDGKTMSRSNGIHSAWQEIGSSGNGNFSLLAYSPLQSNTLFLGGNGLSISTDGGKSLAAQNSGLGADNFYLQLTALPNGMLYLVQGGKVYSSKDQGRAWENLVDTEGTLALDVANNLVYKLLNNEASYSSDQGKTWTNIPLPIQGANPDSIGIQPQSSGRIFVTYGGEYFRVFFSDDKGVNWSNSVTSSSSSKNGNFLLQTNNYQTGRLSIRGDYFPLVSNDGGLTWKGCSWQDTTQSAYSPSAMAIDPDNKEKIVVATNGAGINITTDGCQSWQAGNTGLGSLYVNSVAIDPSNPNTIYAGTDGGAYVSTNGGANWGQVNDGLLGATVVYSIVVDKDSNVYAATPYGIFKLEKK